MQAQRLPSLTGLRFVAALLVVFFHIRVSTAIFYGGFGPARFGFVGVGFFYVLSGFVLTWAAKEQPRARFYALRLARIYPVYLFVFLAVSAYHTLNGEAPSLLAFVTGAFLVQAWFPDSAVHFGVEPVFWSLSCEAFFYLMTPFVEPALRRLSSSRRRVVMAALVGAVVLVATIGWDYSDWRVWFVYVFPATRFIEFLFGITLAHELRARPTGRLTPFRAFAIAAVMYGLLWYAPESFGPAAWMMVPFGLVILAFARSDLAGRTTFASTPALQIGGDVSYALYLIHTSIIGVWDTVLDRLGLDAFDATTGGAGQLLNITALTVTSLVAATLLYRGLERPSEKRLRARIAATSRVS